MHGQRGGRYQPAAKSRPGDRVFTIMALDPLEATEGRIDYLVEGEVGVKVMADVRLKPMPETFDLVEVGRVGR